MYDGHMIDAIRDFNEQFGFEPVVENSQSLKSAKKFLVAGMGGSNLTTGILKLLYPSVDVLAHKDYGLPEVSDIEERLVILSSYSGNTEETISSFKNAHENNLNMLVITTGGELLRLARENQVPYIEIPKTGIQPRIATGFSLLALLKAFGMNKELKEVKKLETSFEPSELEDRGKELARGLKGRVPIIYSSAKNKSLAYYWKITMNETGKIPAFYNVFPELNHNEMTGFDIKETSKSLSEKFHFIFLRDKEDHKRVIKRMDITKDQYETRGLPVSFVDISTSSPEGIFTALTIALWTAYFTAENYDLEPEQVPMVEEFKKLMG